MKKKVINIFSTAFSGSTMLDLMLANGEKGFSCGEVIWMFRPWAKHHINPLCGCGNPDCKIWEKIIEYGDDFFYSGIFNEFPHLDYVVDSSKDLSWLFDQNRNLQSTNIQPINLLLWKEPTDYAYSLWKRGLPKRWKGMWVRYYSTFFSFADNWISVRYRDLAEKPKETIEALCSILGIPYFDEKELFWKGTFHSMFGSDSTKIHLFEKDSVEFNKLKIKLVRSKTNIKKDQINEFANYRKIHYDKRYLDKLPNTITKNRRYHKKITEIKKVLELTDFKETPASSVFQRAKRINHNPFWYYREKALFWILYQKTKIKMNFGN